MSHYYSEAGAPYCEWGECEKTHVTNKIGDEWYCDRHVTAMIDLARTQGFTAEPKEGALGAEKYHPDDTVYEWIDETIPTCDYCEVDPPRQAVVRRRIGSREAGMTVHLCSRHREHERGPVIERYYGGIRRQGSRNGGLA